MNSTTTHTAAGGAGILGGINVYNDLATLLTGFHGLDAAHAQAASELVVYTISLIVMAVVAWMQKGKA